MSLMRSSRQIAQKQLPFQVLAMPWMDHGNNHWKLVNPHLPSQASDRALTLEPVSNLPFIFFLSGLLRLIVWGGTPQDLSRASRSGTPCSPPIILGTAAV